MTPLVAYLLLFVAVGIGFIFVHLVAGKFIRPNKPDASKATIYECGEPTIGSAWIQFDLRFYVIALLFVIFDVEVAFFFPWAEVFGKANALAAVARPDSAENNRQTAERAAELIPPAARENHVANLDMVRNVTAEDVARLKELRQKKKSSPLSPKESEELIEREGKERLIFQAHDQARTLAWWSLAEIAVFFGVLLVGFAYLWRRGDLAWVRSLAAERPNSEAALPPPVARPPAPAPLATTAVHS